jgi:hypothetical protein
MQEKKIETSKVKVQVLAQGMPVQAKPQSPTGVSALGCSGSGACFVASPDMI